jgi:hypothetical protein
VTLLLGIILFLAFDTTAMEQQMIEIEFMLNGVQETSFSATNNL